MEVSGATIYSLLKGHYRGVGALASALKHTLSMGLRMVMRLRFAQAYQVQTTTAPQRLKDENA